MIGANDTKLDEPHEIVFDGITATIWADVGDSTPRELEEYVKARMPRNNGERLSGRNLTLVFFPSEFEGFDTFIGMNVEVGHDVVIGYHTNVGEGTRINSGTVVDHDCTIGAASAIGYDVHVGRYNVLPVATVVDDGVDIPNKCFPQGSIQPGQHITQDFVDDIAAHRSQPVR